MSKPLVAMPIAHPPEDLEPNEYYSRFSDRLHAEWSLSDGLTIDLSDDDSVPTLYAPVRSIVFFRPAGTRLVEGGEVMAHPTLQLKTWPTDHYRLANRLGGLAPFQIIFDNVDPEAVKEMALNLSDDDDNLALNDEQVQLFMNGEMPLLLPAGTPLGKAGARLDSETDDEDGAPSLARSVSIRMYAPDGSDLHPIYFLFEMARLADVESEEHPLLKELDPPIATDPLLSSSYVKIEDPTEAGTFHSADKGLFATLTPRVRLEIPSHEGLQMFVSDLEEVRREVTTSFHLMDGVYEGVIPRRPFEESGWRLLRVTGPVSITVRFMLYEESDSNIGIDFADQSNVKTGITQIKRSDLLLEVLFIEHATDAQIADTFRRHRVELVSMIRLDSYMTVKRSSYISIGETLAALLTEELVVEVTIPGTRTVNTDRGEQTYPVWIKGLPLSASNIV